MYRALYGERASGSGLGPCSWTRSSSTAGLCPGLPMLDGLRQVAIQVAMAARSNARRSPLARSADDRRRAHSR